MNVSLTMNETIATSVDAPEAQASEIASSVQKSGHINEERNLTTLNSLDPAASEIEAKPIEFEESDDLEGELAEFGARNVRHLPKEHDKVADLEDLYEAQENVQNSIMAEPEIPSDTRDLAASNNDNCNATTCLEPADDSLEPHSLNSEPSERRLFGVGTLTEEVRKFRNQRNKLLSRANLKRRKKRKKAMQNEKKNLLKTSQTRQSLTTSGYGSLNAQGAAGGGQHGTNQLTNSFRHHFSNPLQFPASVQKMIMNRLTRQPPSNSGSSTSSSNQHQTRTQPMQAQHSGDTSLPQDLFFHHPATGFIDQQHTEPLNQWAPSETLSSQQSGAKQPYHQHHLGNKMIPIEIIGLDPIVTKSILHSNSQLGGTESQAQADMSHMFAASHGFGGGAAASAVTPVNPVFASELALKDPGSQVAGGLRASGIGTSPTGAHGSVTERPVPSSVLHIHHFHTQAKPVEGIQQQSSTTVNGDEQHIQQQEPPIDMMQQLPQKPSFETIKQQVAGPQQQQQQVYVNEKGELVYLSAGGGSEQSTSGDNLVPSTGGELQDSSGEKQYTSTAGPKQEVRQIYQSPSQVASAQQQVIGDDSQQTQLEQPASGRGEQVASSVIQQRQQAQHYVSQETGMRSQQRAETRVTNNLNRNEPFNQASIRSQQVSSELPPTSPKQRVFVTSTGQMITLMTPGNLHSSFDGPMVGGSDDKLLMVAYKPQEMQQSGAQNATIDDSMMGVRAPYNEGQESQSSLISTSGQQLVLKNPSLLIKNRPQQPDGSLADQVAHQLATLRLKPQQQGIGLWAGRNNKSLIASANLEAQLLANERAASLAAASNGQQLPSMDHQVVQPAANGKPFVLKSKPTMIGVDANNKGVLENNTMNSPTSVLYEYSQQQHQTEAAKDYNLQRTPSNEELTHTHLSTGTTNNLINADLFAGLLKELKSKSGSASIQSGAHLTRANTTFDFSPVNATATTATTTNLAEWDHLVPNYVGNLMMRNNRSNNPPRKVSSPYDNADKDQRHRLNNLIEPAQDSANLREAHAKHQPVGMLQEDSDNGDTTSGLSNLALAFILVLSLVTLAIIAASMIYRHRRRSIGRCADLPSKSRLNLTQRTKRFVFNNFMNPNQEVTSIKSINLNLTDGNSNLPNKKSPNSGGDNGNNGSGGANGLINGNTVTKNNRTERFTATQTFGLAPMSTFAGTPSSQFTDDSSDIKTLKTRLQKSSYLKSLISTPDPVRECPVKLANHKKQQLQQKQAHRGKSNSDASCHLDIKHWTSNANSSLKSPRIKGSNEECNPHGRSHSFSKKINSSTCEVHKQNYNFAFAKGTPSELSFSDRLSIDSSRVHSDRMSTIHSIDDTNDSKANTCETQGPLKRQSNISYRAGKLGNLMGPKTGHSAACGSDMRRNRMDLPQMDRL